MKTAERVLYLLKSRGPQTVAAVAEALELSAMAARQQLEALAGAGLVRHYDQRQGVGRPARHWQLTGAGHARFPDRHGELGVRLLDDVQRLFGADAIEQLIAAREQDMASRYGAALAGLQAPAERLAALARLRSADGYMAEVQAQGAHSWLLLEHHCPICAAATRCQSFCRSELELFRQLLGPGCTVERIEHLPAGGRRCAYRIEWCAAAG